MSNGHRRFCDVAVQTLRSGATIRFRATGQSMAPTILPGSLITVAPLGEERIEVGDIVLYETSHGLRVHRAIGSADSTHRHVIVRGDARGCETEIVSRAAVLGRLITHEQPASGGLLSWFIRVNARLRRKARRMRQPSSR
jgi:hypothetical protein